FETEFEHLDWLDVTNGAEPLSCVSPDPAIDFRNLLVRQPRVGLRNGHQLAVVPQAEGVIGQQTRTFATARLRVDEYRINRVRLDLPFPPGAALPAHPVRGVPAFQHEPFDIALARRRTQFRKRFPARGVNGR